MREGIGALPGSELAARIAGERPPDPALLETWRELTALPVGGSSLENLRALLAGFSRIPYENLSKIVKLERSGSVEAARRTPIEVLREHGSLGAGGTCFSLTFTLLELVRSLGFRAEPILADRHYGADTHSALLVWLDGRAHVVDPGFLIVDPIPVETSRETHVRTAFNELLLQPRQGGERLALHTLSGKQRSERLTFKLDPVDPAQFLRAWDASFGWDMMRYPVLTRVDEQEHLYLQARRLQRRGAGGVEREELDPIHLARTIRERFGVSEQLAHRALELLARRGESI